MNKVIPYLVASCLLTLSVTRVFANPEIRWSFLVGSMPKIEGRIVVRVGFGSNVKYTSITPDATVTLSMPGSRLMIRFKESETNCVNSKNTLVREEENRLYFSGTVSCFTSSVKSGNEKEAAIKGWFYREE